jgi:hypothetical protein
VDAGAEVLRIADLAVNPGVVALRTILFIFNHGCGLPAASAAKQNPVNGG